MNNKEEENQKSFATNGQRRQINHESTTLGPAQLDLNQVKDFTEIDMKIIYINEDKDRLFCCCLRQNSKSSTYQSDGDVPFFEDIHSNINRSEINNNRTQIDVNRTQIDINKYQNDTNSPWIGDTCNYHYYVPQYDPTIKQTFVLQQDNLEQTALRSNQENITILNLHKIAYKLCKKALKKKKKLKYKVNNKITDINNAYIFNKSFLSLPFKYENNKYLLCGQINPDEFKLSKLQTDFNRQYEGNSSIVLYSVPMEQDRIIRFFISKINNRKVI